ncbi:putative spermidine/putrescine transport system substrate-binding protein [Nocardioides albertanoniae]|uniref:Putative spermidine/putrescine transport system substrate-binding protein n=1 Tax=Nocardioides albertanoniae TaxID=1175486 RepID=A0A543A5K3_9ACTN|nr:extracellular solute-binding protein [Nocardioides albertanoniae]TQL67882.1 putative spermidine/putrescine transport system substrate-binding protein [Nocardioides albertanoniae]
MKNTIRKGRVVAACLTLLSVSALSACGSEEKKTAAAEEVGKAEGQVSILAWPGYVEDGTNDPKVDWVSDFEKKTGCQVTSKTYGTSDEAFNLAKSGEYDVVAASGDLSLRLIASDEAQAINTDLVPNYANVYDFLKDTEWNTVDGKNYGVPHGYGANLLMYNKKNFAKKPTSWGAVFDKQTLEKNKGKVTAYDSPIYIADAALYLMKTQPDLGIKNPYALDQKQLDAAVALLKEQRQYVGEYWSDYLKEVQAFESGDSVVGTTWQVIKNNVKNGDVDVTLPSEGATAWNDTWMMSSHTKNPNCAYLWMDHILSPEANAQATEYFGEAPNSPEACAKTTDPKHCETFHAGDEEYAKQLWFWRTPVKECLDGRTDVECTDYAAWTEAWTGIKG